MGTRTPSLKRGLFQALFILVGITTLASATLVSITSVLHDTTRELSAAVETVRIAKDAQRDLLLHARANDRITRSEKANELRSELFETRRYISNDEELAVFERAERDVDAYLRADESRRAELEPAAYEALGDLVRDNIAQADAAQRRATRLDTVANLVGVTTAIAVLLGVAALSWWVRARAFRPVIGLARVIRSYGLGGEALRAPEDGPEELREMARQFNKMADRLAEQRTAHRTYLAAVAHDLRNPLNTLRLAVDSVSGETPDRARLDRVLSIVRRQIARLTRLAEDLLDTSNLAAGRLGLHLSRHDVREIAQATAELFSTTSSKHRIEVVVPDAPALVRCDAQRIEQVLANLVGNAIKYSPDGGLVRVSVETSGDSVQLAVADEGIGMTSEEIEKVIQPYQRAETLRRAVPGHGLGLFIAQRIVEEHCGSMSIDSTPGKGSVIRVVIPAEPRDTPLEHAVH